MAVRSARSSTGAVGAEVVFRDDDAVAFLDRSPLFAGHVLVVPRRPRGDASRPAADGRPVLRGACSASPRRCPSRSAPRERSSPTTTSSARAWRTSTCTSCRGAEATDSAASSGRGRGTRPGEAEAVAGGLRAGLDSLTEF